MVNKGNAATNIEISEAERSNKLIGWLVSYELESEGVYFEIRTGRIFISSDTPFEGAANRANDKRCIILDKQSISSLHMALFASADHKLFVQDVFSEQGTFLKKSGSSEEEQIFGKAEVSHGDSLRLGDKLHLQVCIIDGGSN